MMPEGLQLQYSTGRSVNADGEIIIEGTGVIPTVQVPVNEETLFAEGDPVLDAAVAHLDDATAIDLVDGGIISVGDTVTGEVEVRQRVRYTLTFETDGIVDFLLTDEDESLDTYLRIYDTADNLLIENDDAAEGATAPNSALLGIEVPGDFTVIVEVGTYEDASSGSYTLAVLDAGGGDAPADMPTEEATAEPTAEPTAEMTAEPTAEATSEATAEPTAEPTETVTEEPPVVTPPEATAEATEAA
jgi:hypothetical protein